MRLFIQISTLLLMCNIYAAAHGDLDIRIQAVTSAIDAYPDSAVLYFTRGKLRFQHEEYNASITDVNHSLDKGYQNEQQNIYLAKSNFKLENYSEAKKRLNIYLDNDPNNVVGLNLKARILYGQTKFVESALCFEKVIQLTIRSLPENYLEAADSWSASNHPNKMEKAIQVLELGLDQLGPIISIQEKLRESYLKANDTDRAIQVQYSIIEKSNRKESAYYKLSEIYIELGENEAAKKAAQNAQLHLDKLPRRIRDNTAMKQLEKGIQRIIVKLK